MLCMYSAKVGILEQADQVMPQWPRVMPAPSQLGCDGPHVPSVEFLLPVIRMVP